jgi:peptidoglycan/LPS O-acetylase OafA/YrhL
VFVGVVSYGVYLYHVGVLVFMLKEGLLPVDTASRTAFLAIAVAASVLLGWASHRIVERPCIALGRRLAESRQRDPTGTGDQFAGSASATAAP